MGEGTCTGAYTHVRAHESKGKRVCRRLRERKKESVGERVCGCLRDCVKECTMARSELGRGAGEGVGCGSTILM